MTENEIVKHIKTHVELYRGDVMNLNMLLDALHWPRLENHSFVMTEKVLKNMNSFWIWILECICLLGCSAQVLPGELFKGKQLLESC